MPSLIVVGASNFVELLIILFIFIPLIMIWVFALVDLFARPDLGGLAKVLWMFLIIFLPWLGVLIYFITRPTLPEEEVRAAERS